MSEQKKKRVGKHNEAFVQVRKQVRAAKLAARLAARKDKYLVCSQINACWKEEGLVSPPKETVDVVFTRKVPELGPMQMAFLEYGTPLKAIVKAVDERHLDQYGSKEKARAFGLKA